METKTGCANFLNLVAVSKDKEGDTELIYFRDAKKNSHRVYYRETRYAADPNLKYSIGIPTKDKLNLSGLTVASGFDS